MTASCGASPTSAAANPRRRSAATSSSAIPARPRTTTTSCCGSSSEAQLDWCGLFAYSREDGTYAAGLDGAVAEGLVAERLAELRALQDGITAARRDELIGRARCPCSSTNRGIGRSVREAPEIDGIINVPDTLPVGEFADVEIVDALGPRSDRRGRTARLMPVDPNSLATWANAVTVGRLLLSPLMFWVIPEHDRGSWLAFGLWFLLSLSDGIDGVIARRHGATRSGAFLDPLADKVLVLGAMFTLVSRDVFPIAPVLIIAAREFVISIYRTVVGSHGVSVPASRLAKYKTLTQQLAVGFALMPLTALDATWLWTALLWLAVALALISGTQYLYRSRVAARLGAGACDVTSWPSAPNCCSARSSTPTRPGSASSWPPTGSTPTCTSRSATTSVASRRCCGTGSPRPTPSSSAAASDRPTTISPERRSPP